MHSSDESTNSTSPATPTDLVKTLCRKWLFPHEQSTFQFLALRAEYRDTQLEYPLSSYDTEVVNATSEFNIHTLFEHVHANSRVELALLSQVLVHPRVSADRARVQHDIPGYHLPFLNLAIQQHGRALERITHAIGTIPLPFEKLYVFWSGTSYHVYADRFLSESEWYRFMGDSLLWVYTDHDGAVKNLVDVKWVGRSLRQGRALIRVSKRAPNQHNTGSRPMPMYITTIAR
jgi:hypothetical protein